MAMSPEERKRRKRERFKQRYDEDPEFRAKDNAKCGARYQSNKTKIKAELRRRYETDPEFRAAKLAASKKSRRKNHLKTKYGMSLEEFAARLDGQGGLCLICLKRHEKSLCVDHDHNTKQLRSLLCSNCNVGLGNFNDDSAALRRAGDYVDYWQLCHPSQSNAGPPPFVLAAANRFLSPTRQTVQYLEPEGDIVTPAAEPTEESKASRMMRRAILHELLRPFDPDPPPPVDMLQAVSRAIVVKAWQGDMTAAKEILGRIDGKTPTAVAPASAEIPNEVFFTWQRP